LIELNAVLGAPDDATNTRRAAEASPTIGALNRLRTIIEDLRTKISGPAFSTAGATLMAPVFRRLTTASAGYDAEAFERRAADVYGAPAGLRADLLTIFSVAEAPAPALEILAMQHYVQEAAVPESRATVDLDELIIDRRLVLARLTIDVATTAPHQLEELSANFEIFRQRYESAYTDHHRRFHATVVELRTVVTEAAQPLEALTILNRIGQLGPAVGTNLQQQATNLLGLLAPCARTPGDLQLDLRTQPHCRHCEIELARQPIGTEVERWQRDLAGAMDTQRRRLASAMVTHAVRETGRASFDRFLRAVRAGDVAPIVDVIDEEIAELIRTLLTEDH
jgi:hypothetical protein